MTSLEPHRSVPSRADLDLDRLADYLRDHHQGDYHPVYDGGAVDVAIKLLTDLSADREKYRRQRDALTALAREAIGLI